MFYRWQRLLSDTIAVCPVSLPGRESRFREAAVDDMEAMLDQLDRHVAPYLESPYALFGHSMGGMIGFEFARRMTSLGRSPAMLFISACRAPGRIASQEPMHHLPDDELIGQLVREYGQAESTSRDEIELMRLMIATIRADLRLLETYRYDAGEPLSCPIVAIAATNDRQVALAEIQSWRSMTTGKFTLRQVVGGHFYLRADPRGVIRIIEQRLQGVRP